MKNCNIIILFIFLLLIKEMNPQKIPKLPKKLKIGYASWGECDEKIFFRISSKRIKCNYMVFNRYVINFR